MEYPALMTAKEVSKKGYCLLPFCASYINDLASDGLIGFKKIRGRKYYTEQHIEEFLKDDEKCQEETTVQNLNGEKIEISTRSSTIRRDVAKDIQRVHQALKKPKTISKNGLESMRNVNVVTMPQNAQMNG